MFPSWGPHGVTLLKYLPKEDNILLTVRDPLLTQLTDLYSSYDFNPPS